MNTEEDPFKQFESILNTKATGCILEIITPLLDAHLIVNDSTDEYLLKRLDEILKLDLENGLDPRIKGFLDWKKSEYEVQTLTELMECLQFLDLESEPTNELIRLLKTWAAEFLGNNGMP